MDANNTRGLTPAQRTAALLLAGGKSSKVAAKAAGVTEQTVCDWKRNPEFVSMLDVERKELEEHLRHHLREASIQALHLRCEALEVVRGHLRSPTPAISLRAAQVILGKTEDVAALLQEEPIPDEQHGPGA